MVGKEKRWGGGTKWRARARERDEQRPHFFRKDAHSQVKQ